MVEVAPEPSDSRRLTTTQCAMTGVRYASVIDVRPEEIDRYEELHRNVPSAVLATIADCHIANYSIFRLGERLFSYYEYRGEDHEADMRRMSNDLPTQEWWRLCQPLQRQTPDRVADTWWTPASEVFHVD